MLKPWLIWFIAKKRDTQQNLTLDSASAPIGPELDAFRMLILEAVMNDPVTGWVGDMVPALRKVGL